MYHVEILPHAELDLAASLRYITVILCNPQAAKGLRDEYKRKKKLLSEMPYAFPLVRNEQLAQRGIRSVLVKNYLMFYTIDETKKKVSILRFLYGRRDWQHITML
jgi:plasmid stabilization system protein ParE